jgi:hypothetical protein
MEQRVTGEHHLVTVVLHEKADAVLRMAWRVKTFDRDVFSDLEAFSLARCLGYAFAVLATDNR